MFLDVPCNRVQSPPSQCLPRVESILFGSLFFTRSRVEDTWSDNLEFPFPSLCNYSTAHDVVDSRRNENDVENEVSYAPGFTAHFVTTTPALVPGDTNIQSTHTEWTFTVEVGKYIRTRYAVYCLYSNAQMCWKRRGTRANARVVDTFESWHRCYPCSNGCSYSFRQNIFRVVIL